MRKNLLYFLCPIAANDEWRANVAALRPHLSAFDGRRVVSVAQDHETCGLADVRAAFAGDEVELVVVSNDPMLGETPAFLPALARVRSTNPDEATFYAHAKGVTPHRPAPVQANLRRWRDLMYRHCLGDLARVEAALADHACCGCFKKYGDVLPEIRTSWHFSGSFFWFRHDRLFTRAWAAIEASRFGVEGYLAGLFDAGEAACLFGDDPHGYRLDLFTEDDWTRLANGS